MKIEKRMELCLAKEKYVPNKLMPLEKKSAEKIPHKEFCDSRGYTLRMGPSNIWKNYMKQSTMTIK